MEIQISSATLFGIEGIFLALGVFVALLCVIVFGVMRSFRRAQREIDEESRKLSQRFSSYSPKAFSFYNRSYLVMDFEGFRVIATWFFEAVPLKGRKPFGLLHVKIPRTKSIRIHATTGLHTRGSIAPIAGWRCLENGICLGKMLKTTQEDSEAIANQISSEAARLMSDTKRFPYGVSIISNLHERMVGKDAAMIMANGDESQADDLDLQIRFSFDLSDDGIHELVNNAIDLAGRLEKDLSLPSTDSDRK